MDFTRAYNEFDLGTVIIVSDGTPEPPNPESILWKAWSSHNFTATLVEKVENPKCLKFSILTDWGELNPCIPESTLHSFERAFPIINDYKEARWDLVKVRRDKAIDGGCATPLGRIDSDLVSRTNISGAVSMAQIAKAASQPFSMNWTMEDNSVIVHDADAMIAAGIAVGQHVDACHEVARSLRESIESATTIDEVVEIDVEAAPWP